jgi:2',3'-cyclic-nucleotide 2'-phosphodiesterase (5'-nucleotidase family)
MSIRWSVLFPLALLVACGGAAKETRTGPSPTSTSTTTAAPTDSSGEGSDVPAVAKQARDPSKARLSVFALSDFHGWLLPLEPKGFSKFYGGVANIGGFLSHRERFDKASSLILDNGDMWTGPTESTFLRGASVIEAYNTLGVDAVNIANHEFDFGIEVLRARASEAKFPFLGANIVKAGTNDHPDFVKPFSILERDGVKIGVLGLSFLDTPRTTLAKHVAGLEFQAYVGTLKRYVPEMKKAGADVVIVLFHDVLETVETVIKQVPELQIDAVVAGQNHRKGQALVGKTPIVNPGPFGRSYVRFDIDVDRASKKVGSVKHEIVDVTGEVGAPSFAPSPELMAVAESARQRAKNLSGEVLGRLAKPLPQGTFADSPLGHFIVDTWLAALPDVDVAVCNHGALRQPLPSGPVTLGDLLGVMPFENNLFIVKITGKQLKSQLAIDSPVVSGITWSYRESKDGTRSVVSLVDRVGKPLEDAKKYTVAVNDFMYTGGDGFGFKELDGAPEDTGLSWRQPVIRALRLAESSNRKSEPQSTARARAVK